MRIEMKDLRRPHFRQGRAVGFVVVAIALTGIACERGNAIPTEATARAALETSLTAWRDGKKPTDTVKADPPVHSVDNVWNSGRKLASFEILREEPSETDRRFAVKLQFVDKPTEAEVVYVVLNTQPFAVFRQDDFDRNMNMDNNPTVKKKR